MRSKTGVTKVAIGTIAVVGVVWTLATFVLGLWSKTAAADHVTSNLKSTFSASGIHQAQTDVASVDAFVGELTTKTIPFLATQLHTTPAQVTALLAQKFPDVGRVLAVKNNQGTTFADGKPYLAHAADYLSTVVTAVHERQGDFAKASAIPTKSLPTTALAWLFLVLGLVTIALTALLIRKATPGRLYGITAAVLGLVVIAVTLVLDVPGKTQSLDRVTNTFRPVFATSGQLSIAEGQQYLTAVRAADVALETKVVPALPQLLGISSSATVAALQANSPVVAAALLNKDPGNPQESVLNGIVTRFDGIAATVKGDITDFRRVDQIPGLGWPATSVQVLLALPGLLLILAGAGLVMGSASTGAAASRSRDGALVGARS